MVEWLVTLPSELDCGRERIIALNTHPTPQKKTPPPLKKKTELQKKGK